jgi:hypothetical protein
MPLSPIPSNLPTSTYEHLVLEALGEIAVGSTINYNPPILDTALFRHLVLNALQYIANNPGGGGSGTVTSITAGTGLTGGTITTSGTIAIDSTVVVKDANNNISANAFFNNLATITASGTQVVLTAASSPVSLVTGSGGQTIKLPNATTLTKGTIFSFNNNQSSGAILVNNNSNTLIVSIPSGGYVTVVLLDNATAAGSWDRHDQSPSNVSWSTNTLDYPGSITSATWNGNAVAVNRGGTGSTTAPNALTALGAIAKAGDTMTGKLVAAADATISKLNIGNALSTAANPTTTVDGDVWINNGNRIAYKANSSVYTLAPVNSSNSFTAIQSVEVTSASTAFRITQKGTGEAFRVEDDPTTPDTTPFVISNAGRVGIGVTPDATVALSVDTTGLKFGDGTIQTTAATSSGTVTSVTGTSPIASSGGATPAISIANAAADGATKGAAAFNASDFDATAGVVSIDYTNGQAASASVKGFLTSTDWTTFNSKGVGTVTSVSATAPLTSTGGATPTISTSMATNKLLGRGALGVGTAQEISIGTGLSLDIGTLNNTGVLSETTGITGADKVTNIVSLTQAEYNAITPNASTLYIITD